MHKPVVVIENWTVLADVSSPAFAELRQGNRLMGNVYGHTLLPHAKVVYTSPIVSVDLDQGLIETLNTIYQLGEANDEYKIWNNKRKQTIAA